MDLAGEEARSTRRSGPRFSAWYIGLLDPEALRAARGRVEWRPSLTMLDEVIEEFFD